MEEKLENKLNLSQIGVILYFIATGSLCGMNFRTYINIAKEDAWLAPIIGCIIGFLPYLIFIFILSYCLLSFIVFYVISALMLIYYSFYPFISFSRS